MAVGNRPLQASTERDRVELANGAAWAAFLAAAIGAFAMGFLIIINQAGLLTIPALYGPAGGVSGRTTFAALIWLIAWGVLHSRWKRRQMEPRRVRAAALVLIALGILGAFPPLWGLF